jgi:hypothetical protein
MQKEDYSWQTIWTKTNSRVVRADSRVKAKREAKPVRVANRAANSPASRISRKRAAKARMKKKKTTRDSAALPSLNTS